MREPTVPRIACSKCGTKHHIDAASLDEQGLCRNCSAFLRRPTEEEEIQFGEFLLVQMAADAEPRTEGLE